MAPVSSILIQEEFAAMRVLFGVGDPKPLIQNEVRNTLAEQGWRSIMCDLLKGNWGPKLN